MGPLTDRQFWGDIANNTRQAAGGLLSATLGAPVDIATMLMRPFGYKVDDKKVVGSSEHIAGLLGLDTESIPYRVASLLPTDATDLMKYGAVAPGLMGSVKSVKGGLLSDGMKKAKPLTEAQFNRAYMAHKDLRGVREGTLEQNLKSIAESGFRRGFNVNLLPPYAGGAPTSIVDRAYAPKAGDVMYLIPQEGRVQAGNGFVTKEGYKPAPHEVLRITEDFPSLYQEYLKAWAATNKP